MKTETGGAEAGQLVLELLRIERDGTVADAGVELPLAAREACALMAQLYARSAFAPPWTGYLARCEGEIVGTSAFKGPPQNDRVEIAYLTFAEHERRGVATSMASGLIRIARDAAPDVVIIAQTLPQENASTRILRKLGFAHAGMAHDEDAGEVWEWHLHPGFRLR